MRVGEFSGVIRASVKQQRHTSGGERRQVVTDMAITQTDVENGEIGRSWVESIKLARGGERRDLSARAAQHGLQVRTDERIVLHKKDMAPFKGHRNRARPSPNIE